MILAVYAVGMAHVTGAGTVYDLFLYGGEIRPEQINLLPFSRHVDLTAYLLNIVLFLPFGFLVPWFCSRMSRGRPGWQRAAWAFRCWWSSASC